MATFNKHYGNIEQTLWQHLTNIMATFTNIMATFNKHYGNI